MEIEKYLPVKVKARISVSSHQKISLALIEPFFLCMAKIIGSKVVEFLTEFSSQEAFYLSV